MHALLIYTKSLKNNYKIVHFSVKFKVMGGRGEIMAGRGWSWMVAAKLWLVVGGGGKLWMVVGGRGWSHDFLTNFRRRIQKDIF